MEYTAFIYLHDLLLAVELTVIQGHAGNRNTSPEPNDFIVDNVYLNGNDITILIEEGNLTEEVKRLSIERYNS